MVTKTASGQILIALPQSGIGVRSTNSPRLPPQLLLQCRQQPPRLPPPSKMWELGVAGTPACSHERAFIRPVWNTLYEFPESAPWESLADLEASIQSLCQSDPTCSGYQKLSCKTSWISWEYPPPAAGYASDCKVRFYCNSDYPNWLCDNHGQDGKRPMW